jgi:hypothetical protein
MRLVIEVKAKVLADETHYENVYQEGIHSKDPSPLKVKEVIVNNMRYIVCKNERQARRDEANQNTIVESLKEKIAKAPSLLISNKGYLTDQFSISPATEKRHEIWTAKEIQLLAVLVTKVHLHIYRKLIYIGALNGSRCPLI